jgi:hypothetical protein
VSPHIGLPTTCALWTRSAGQAIRAVDMTQSRTEPALQACPVLPPVTVIVDIRT